MTSPGGLWVVVRNASDWSSIIRSFYVCNVEGQLGYVWVWNCLDPL